MRYGLGVDLGTSFVAAAVARPGRTEVVQLGDRSVVAPAVVHRHGDGTLVTGDAAGRWGLSHPGQSARDMVRRLGDPAPIVLGGVPHAVTDLLGVMLRDVVRTVGEAQGGPPERVVLTRPASWGPLRRGLFDQVAAAAGLQGAVSVAAPEAATAHYAASRRPREGEIVAVYDLGGGTFDAAVVRTGPHRAEILGTPEGVERLGGIDVDDAILSCVNHRSGGALGELDRHDPRTAVALARLRQDCVLAKEALSVDGEAAVPLFLPDRHLEVRLTRADLEDMLRAPVESTISALFRALRSARVSPHELGAVLMVGGSSRIPLVNRMVSDALRGPALVSLHPDHTMALGAAELAARMPGGGATRTPAPQHPAGTPRPAQRRPAPAAPILPPPGRAPARAVPGPEPAAADVPAASGGDWQAPSIGRMLAIGTGLLALVLVVGLVAYVVISRL